MAKPKKRDKVMLFFALTYKSKETLKKVLDEIKEKFGETVLFSEEYNFSHSNYYENEMGEGLKKILVFFETLIERFDLADTKLFTNKLEEKYLSSGNRTINIDPGYLTLHNVVLASCKELPHRLFIGKDIFAEVTLTFKDKEFVDSTTTFPDYKDTSVKDFLKKARALLYKKLKE